MNRVKRPKNEIGINKGIPGAKTSPTKTNIMIFA